MTTHLKAPARQYTWQPSDGLVSITQVPGATPPLQIPNVGNTRSSSRTSVVIDRLYWSHVFYLYYVLQTAENGHL